MTDVGQIIVIVDSDKVACVNCKFGDVCLDDVSSLSCCHDG